jgi:hypothetical protein
MQTSNIYIPPDHKKRRSYLAPPFMPGDANRSALAFHILSDDARAQPIKGIRADTLRTRFTRFLARRIAYAISAPKNDGKIATLAKKRMTPK